MSAYRQSNANNVTIAVMGATGTGKSTFINLASGSNLQVGGGLRSCTSTVNHSQGFDLDGVRVTLIDTPGFDDTTVSDTDILKMIGIYLATAFEQGHKLSGVIYMHRICDYRMGGISRKNFSMFRKLCGDNTLQNVIIATNMWAQVSPEVGEARELELRTDDLLFKPVIEKGANMRRHDNTRESALRILREIIKKSPIALRIQQELVQEKKDITETAACEELDRDIVEVRKKHQAEMAGLKQHMKDAMRERDMQAKEELEIVRRELEKNVAEIEQKRSALSREYAEEKARIDKRMQKLGSDLKGERAANGEYQKKFNQTYEEHKAEVKRLKEDHERERLEDERKIKDLKKADEEKAQQLRKDIERLHLQFQKAREEDAEKERRREAERERREKERVDREREDRERAQREVVAERLRREEQYRRERENEALEAQQQRAREIEVLRLKYEDAKRDADERMRRVETQWAREEQTAENRRQMEDMRQQLQYAQEKIEQTQKDAEDAKNKLGSMKKRRGFRRMFW